MKLSFLILLAAPALSASFGERYDGDFEFLEQKFSLKVSFISENIIPKPNPLTKTSCA